MNIQHYNGKSVLTSKTAVTTIFDRSDEGFTIEFKRFNNTGSSKPTCGCLEEDGIVTTYIAMSHKAFKRLNKLVKSREKFLKAQRQAQSQMQAEALMAASDWFIASIETHFEEGKV
jgi:hypothetical protein|tara:strand:- start:1677 stop:2024 length:348 start_codon:yes stop_codon:yes gene_type:complete